MAARLRESTSKAREDMEDLKSCMMAIMSKAMLGPGTAVDGEAVGAGGALMDMAELAGMETRSGIAGIDGGNLGRKGVTEGLKGVLTRSANSGSTPVGVTVSGAGMKRESG